MKPGNPPLQSIRLLDQLRERIRYLHYSFSTEKLYVYWVRFFIHWHGLKHPRDIGASEVEGFLTMLATERKASASAHNRAQNALLFCTDSGRAPVTNGTSSLSRVQYLHEHPYLRSHP